MVAEKEAARLRTLDEAGILQHPEEIAKNEEARLRKQVEVAEKEEEHSRILLEGNEPGGAARVRKLLEKNGDAKVGGSNCPLGSGQSCKDSHGPWPNENSQQRGAPFDKGKGPLEPRRDTPRVGEVESAVVPHNQWPKFGEELAPDAEEPVQVAQLNSSEEYRTAQERSAPDPEEPVQVAQSSSSEEYWLAQEQLAPELEEPVRDAQSSPSGGYRSVQEEQSDSNESPILVEPSNPIGRLSSSEPLNSIEQPSPVGQSSTAAQSTSVGQSDSALQSTTIEENSATEAGPATQKAQNGLHNKTRPNYRARRDAIIAERKRIRAAQEALAPQLNPAAQPFTATPVVEAVEPVPAKQLNPAAQPFEATPAAEAARPIVDRWFNPPKQPFTATRSPIVLKSITTLQSESDPEKQAVSDRRLIPYTQPDSSVWPRLARALDTVLTLTESNILRHASDGPLTIGAYNKIHFGGLGRSMPKGGLYCKSLFRREPAPQLPQPAPPGPPPPPALQQPPSPRAQGPPYQYALIDDDFALPPPELAWFDTPCEHRKPLFSRVAWGGGPPPPPPPPVPQHLRSPCRQILAYPQTFIDDGFALPPPAFSGPTTTWEQTSEQPVTEEEVLPENPVWSWLVQLPNGRAPEKPLEPTPERRSCASAVTREPQTGEGESSVPVDERTDKRAVGRDYREIRALKTWRRE
jgi:hypothetical protein